MRNVHQKQENLGKEIYHFYEKEEKEDNLFSQTKQGDEAIINTPPELKEGDKSKNQEPEYQDPRLRSRSIYQNGERLSSSEKQELKQSSEVVYWKRFSGVGEYDHMDIIDYIHLLFVYVHNIPDYWITTRINTEFRCHKNIWYTEMKEINFRKKLAMVEEQDYTEV
ncbi:hypothetical protein O181_072100 [Austropuccinia psidii MF-1]|uniref:Uncharacterized protein n=1 Tax=Austropuccinia psidii MF-1 TaxID=1389203 RepID=A0A9Q3F803_9BASI|nr:hypothetical protein [Austropuccinia psidii MF-1]